MDIELRQRVSLGDDRVDAGAAGQELNQRPLADHKHATAPALHQRREADELDGIAQTLFGMEQNRLAGERLSVPGRLRVGRRNHAMLPPPFVFVPPPLELAHQQPSERPIPSGPGMVGVKPQGSLIARQCLIELSLAAQRIAKIHVKSCNAGPALQGTSITSDCLVQPPLQAQRVSQAILGVGVVGTQLEDLAVARLGFIEPPLIRADVPQVQVDLCGTGLEPEGVFIALHSKLELSTQALDVRQVIVGVVMAGLESKSLLVRRCRFLESFQLSEHVAQGVANAGDLGLQTQGVPVAELRVLELTQLGQRGAQIEMRLVHVGVEPNGVTIARHGKLSLALVAQRVGQVKMGIDVVGLDGDGGAVGSDRCVVLARAPERDAEVVPVFSHDRIERNRPADQLDRFHVPLLVVSDQAQQLQGVGVVGSLGQDLGVDPLGLGETAGAMMFKRQLKGPLDRYRAGWRRHVGSLRFCGRPRRVRSRPETSLTAAQRDHQAASAAHWPVSPPRLTWVVGKRRRSLFSARQAMVESVLVLGAGTAGLLSAIALKTKIPRLRVTLLGTDEPATSASGEGTAPHFRELVHRYLGIGLPEFYREVAPTPKLGTRYIWGPRPSFNLPFGSHVLAQPEGFARPLGYYCDDDMENLCQASSLMSACRAFPVAEDGSLVIVEDMAYHLDLERLATFLIGHAAKLGVECRERDDPRGKAGRARRGWPGHREWDDASGRRLCR